MPFYPRDRVIVSDPHAGDIPSEVVAGTDHRGFVLVRHADPAVLVRGGWLAHVSQVRPDPAADRAITPDGP